MGIDFTGDLDLPLPEGEEWDEELGLISFLFLTFYVFFLLIHVCPYNNCIYTQMLA